MIDFLKKNWLWVLIVGLVVLWFYGKKRQPASTGSLAQAVGGVANSVETTIADLSAAWVRIRGDLGFDV